MNVFVKTIATLPGLFFIGFGSGTSAEDHSDKDQDLPYLSQPMENVLVGGQPSLRGLEQLKGDSVSVIINFRGAGEFDEFDEASVAEQLGFAYYNVPITDDSGRYSSENATALHQILETLPEGTKIYMHCTVGFRASVMLGLDQYLFHDMNAKDAVKLTTEAHMPHSGERLEAVIDALETSDEGQP